MKKKELFSYKRYFTWFTSGVILSCFIYYVIRLSVPPNVAIDEEGHIEDLSSYKLINGVALVLIITMANYLDTRTRTYFFEIIIFFVMTVIPTGSYYIAENYFAAMNYYHNYTDNMNLRFWLTIFFIVSVIYIIKVAIQTYEIE